ncbi:MAG: hypothetical protein R3351_09740 [Nitrospirales bacterium]|nr:hypothetical protein [Nitrospirales bacterium]
MEWKTLLAYSTGPVDQELLLRNEYLVEEHRILRNQIRRRVRLNDRERTTLAALGKRLGKKALAEVVMASHRSRHRAIRPSIRQRESHLGI